jgi:hypothetical protein
MVMSKYGCVWRSVQRAMNARELAANRLRDQELNEVVWPESVRVKKCVSRATRIANLNAQTFLQQNNERYLHSSSQAG